MAITTLDQVITGMQPPVEFSKLQGATTVANRMYTNLYVNGNPGIATVPSPGVAGEALTTYSSGQLAFVNGAADQYLARFTALCDRTGTLYLCDRLWHNSGLSVTLTSAQTVNSVAWPARDHNASINGEGVYVGVEVSTITGAGVGGALNMSYTNQSGTAGQTGTVRIDAAATMAVGTFLDMTLAAGDTGVRSIETYTNPATLTSGAIHLVAYRVLARVGFPVAAAEVSVDALTSGMPKLHNDTVPYLVWLPNGTGGPVMCGQFIQTNG